MGNTEIPKFYKFRKHNAACFLSLSLFSCIGNCSNWGSPKEFFIESFWIGFVFSGSVYLLFLMSVLFKDKPMSKGTYKNPMIIVLVVGILLSIFEILLMNIVAGYFGGSMIGSVVTTIIFWLSINKNNE